MRRNSRFPLAQLTAALVAALALPWPGVAGQGVVPATVVRIGDYVERYYARAQSVVADEAVSVQPLARDLGFDGFPRRLVYELRLEWNPYADADNPATVTRQLISVNGRPPRPGEEPECLDPRGVSPEPLAFLLPERRHKFTFTAAGVGRVDEQAALMIDYRSLRPEPPKVEWDEECASVDLPGRSRGRIWIDPESAAILRFDEQLVGMVDIEVPWAHQRRGAPAFMTIERADTSIRYRSVTFTDPDETLVLPSTIESLTIIRNSGVPRVRITQTFSNYRRFVTDSRIVQ